ncbi:MAG: signal recognition particle receptor subunit alpha, partial [bacterium]
MGFVRRLRDGLIKTRQGLVGRISDVVTGRERMDAGLIDEVEKILIQADVGVSMTSRIIENIRERLRRGKLSDPEKIIPLLKDQISTILTSESLPPSSHLPRPTTCPHVILMVGVNGTGKTTTIGKLAYRFRSQGKKVLLAAADTFRAAAIEQLEIWAERAGADVVRHQPGADPASVVFDSLNAALARGIDVLI